MIEKTIEIPTADGSMESFAVHPDGDGPFPAVILYMDAPGIREELRDFCRRIASEGYYALLPDMYYRQGRFRMTRFDDAAYKEMFAAMRRLNNRLVMRDTGAMLEFLGTESVVDTGSKGCIGYCMSGQYVVSATGCYPQDFAAAASLYGVGIVTEEDDSPHKLADQMQGELYLGFAQTDQWVPDNVIPDLKVALDQHGVDHRIDVWPNTHHGFCFPQRDAYHEESAEQVWALVFDLFKRKLAGP